eukprot:scaffold15975_cov27-Tisochrysis_lutea.AAC.3
MGSWGATPSGSLSARTRERMARAAVSECARIWLQTETPKPTEMGSGAAVPSARENRWDMGRIADMASSTRRDVPRNSSCSHEISWVQRAALLTSAAATAGSIASQCLRSMCINGKSGGGGTCPSCRCCAAVTSTLGPSASSATTIPSAGTPFSCST